MRKILSCQRATKKFLTLSMLILVFALSFVPMLSVKASEFTSYKGYCRGEASYQWRNRVSTQSVATGDDVGKWISYDFTFFGESKSRVYVCSNGFLIFDPTPATNDWSNTISELKTRCMIAVFWDDLRTNVAGGIVSTPGVYVDYFIGDPYNADLNNDGVVDDADMEILSNAWYSTPGDPNWDPRADVDGNGIVDLFDVSYVARYYGKSSNMVITWEATRFFASSDSIKFQVVLFKNGDIRISINGATNFGNFSPTIGISKGDGAGYTYVGSDRFGTWKTWLFTYDCGCFMWERPGYVGHWPYDYTRKGACLMIPGGYVDHEDYGECGCGPPNSRNYAPDYWYPYWGSYYFLSDIKWDINQYSDAQSITGHSYCYVSEFRIAEDYGSFDQLYSTLPNAKYYIHPDKDQYGPLDIWTWEGEVYTRTPEQIVAGRIYWADAHLKMTTGVPKDCMAYEYEMKIDHRSDCRYLTIHPGGYPLDWWKVYSASMFAIERPIDCPSPIDILSVDEFPSGARVLENVLGNTILIRTVSLAGSKDSLVAYINSRTDALDDVIKESNPNAYIPVTMTFNAPFSPLTYAAFCKSHKLEPVYYRFVSTLGSGISVVTNPEKPFRWDLAKDLWEKRKDVILGVTAVYGLVKVKSINALKSNPRVLLTDPKEDLVVQEYIDFYSQYGEEIAVEYPDDIWVEYKLYGE